MRGTTVRPRNREFYPVIRELEDWRFEIPDSVDYGEGLVPATNGSGLVMSHQGSNSSPKRGFRHKAIKAVNGGMPVAEHDCMLRQNITSITERFPGGDLTARPRVVRQHGSWTVHLELSIKAEVRRLFHALTAPEYIETWISFPGHPACCANVAKMENDFLISHLCEGVATTRISGRFSVCERRNLTFSWRVEGERNVSTSFVNIRLSGDFEYTTLQLKHGGFASRDHYGWHQSLWSSSLTRLKRLYDSPLSYA